MYLKRLELQGFKSFADKTILDFGEGVTAVVGPNGSGKSNISDAIRWVLGEMSAKSLRGGSMQDVIFAGTQKRKQVNYAEVSLVLDNSDHTFAIDFDEVVVTRRVFRSGETAYQINNANCRLRDIHELFMDTGLGRDGYSIIGQGNVSQVLSTKAEDRRNIFEEAAGIAKYKHRKEEAQHKLSGVQDNLVRIDDKVTELGKRVEPLRNQSEKARRYLELYDEYKQLDVYMGLKKIDDYEAQIEKNQQQIQSVSAELDEVRQQSNESELKIARLDEEAAKQDQVLADIHEELRGYEKDQTELAGEIKIAEHDIEHNDEQTAKITEDIRAEDGKRTQWKQEIDALNAEIIEKEGVYGKTQQDDTLQKEIEDIVCRLETCLGGIDEKKSAAFELRSQIVSDAAKRDGTEKLRSNFLERKEAVQTQLEAHGAGLEQINRDISEARKQIDDKQEKLEKMRGRAEKQESELERLQEAARKTNEMLMRLQNDYQTKQSRKRMLEDMENAYEGYARSVKSVLTAPQLKRLAIYGTLSGLIHVQREYVTAIETALGGAMQNIVVENEEDAKEAIAYLRSNKAGRATFLPVSAVKGRRLEQEKEAAQMIGYIGVAADLVSCDKKYGDIVANLLGRVAVFDDIDHAIAASRKFGYRFKIVTLTGEVFNPGGSMSGGSNNKGVSFLSRTNDIEQLGKELASMMTQMREQKEKQQKIQQDSEAAARQAEASQTMIREYEDELLRLRGTAEHLQASLDDSGTTEQAMKDELAELEQQLAETGNDIAKLIDGIQRGERQAKEKEQEIAQMQEEAERLTALREEKQKEGTNQTMKLREIEQAIASAKEKIETRKEWIAESEEREKLQKAEIERMCEQSKEIAKRITEKQSRKEKLICEAQKQQEKIKAVHAEKDRISEEQKKIRLSDKDLNDRRVQLGEEKTRVEAKTVNLNVQKENIISRFWDKYEMTYTAATELSIELPEEDRTEKRLSELNGKIKSLGHVNMDAIEEYVAVKEEFEFLSEQKSDLEKSRANLNEIIASMDELMQQNFAEQFCVINESFGKVFTELFGGGRGRLYLSEPDNVLESGIEIEVQLPGKGLQNISLYSGGEKSFIAIALLFAILNVKPTPFCILDEIDAALDDVNVSRFATYLKNYLEQTQFIVITHRRGTMEAANLMYGVTMQEKGISKLLSLHIDDVEEGMIQ